MDDGLTTEVYQAYLEDVMANYGNEEMTISQPDVEQLIEGVNQINVYLGTFLVVGGIVISVLLTRFIWRYVFKPILRNYIKLPL